MDRPWHLAQNKRVELCDLWAGLGGWGGSSECSGNWMLWPLPFFFSFFFFLLSLTWSLSETRPALHGGSRVWGCCWNPGLWHVTTGPGCLVISDATPPRLSSSNPPKPLSTQRCCLSTSPGKTKPATQLTPTPHLKLSYF